MKSGVKRVPTSGLLVFLSCSMTAYTSWQGNANRIHRWGARGGGGWWGSTHDHTESFRLDSSTRWWRIDDALRVICAWRWLHLHIEALLAVGEGGRGWTCVGGCILSMREMFDFLATAVSTLWSCFHPPGGPPHPHVESTHSYGRRRWGGTWWGWGLGSAPTGASLIDTAVAIDSWGPKRGERGEEGAR